MLKLFTIWCLALNPTQCIERQDLVTGASYNAMQMCYRQGFVQGTTIMLRHNDADWKFGGIRCEPQGPNPVRQHIDEMAKRLGE